MQSTLPTSKYAHERSFVRNVWYVAAWAGEIADRIVGRTVLDIPVALYRLASGEVAALLDICPHKYAPLSLGQRVADTVQCGYHGLRFDKAGTCVYNPQGNHRIPPGAQVRTFPVVERHGAVWIWMGNPQLASAEHIPHLGILDDPSWRTVCGNTVVAGHYQLSIDNLMDLGHALFLHAATAGDLGDAVCEIETGQDGELVWDRRLYRSMPLPGQLARRFDRPEGEAHDLVLDIEWRPAGIIQNVVAVSAPGEARRSGNVLRGIHCLTPATAGSTHYFYANARNYLQRDQDIDRNLKRWQEEALKGEDSVMVEAIERRTASALALGIKQIYLSTDASGGRVRRVIETMVARENVAP